MNLEGARLFCRTGISLTLVSLLVVSGGAVTGRQSKKPAEAVLTPQPNPIFAEILPTLRQKTRVPLRLPAFVPFSDRKLEESLKKDEGEENLYATIAEVSEKSYAIQLAFGRDCQGAHVCRDGGLTGSAVFYDGYPDRQNVRLKLRGNIPGSFVRTECGAYCDESILYWSENGYHYSVSSKAATKEQLMKIANSAIEVAQAESRHARQKGTSENNTVISKQETAGL